MIYIYIICVKAYDINIQYTFKNNIKMIFVWNNKKYHINYDKMKIMFPFCL